MFKSVFKILGVLLCLTWLNTQGISQDINAFNILNNKLYTFNKGRISLVEFQPTSNLTIGLDYVAYTNSRGDYNAIYNNQKITLTQGQTNLFSTNNYLVYQIASVLRVFEKGKTQILTSYVSSFGVGDSLVVFQDQIGGNLKYYYKNNIVEFAQVLGNYEILQSHIGENVFVYEDNSGGYRAFYQGKFYDLFSSNQSAEFSSGLNLIAFNDLQNRTFSMFYKGEIFDIENQFVEKYKAGHDFVYYMDNNEVNKVYYHDEIQELGYDLQEIQVYDSLIVFKEADYPKIWYKGEIHTAYNDRFSNYQVSGGNLAYINGNGGVSAFIGGEVIEITKQRVESYSLKGNTIVLKYSPSAFSVWWNGKMFNF